MKAIVNAAVCPLKAEPKWESTLADEFCTAWWWISSKRPLPAG